MRILCIKKKKYAALLIDDDGVYNDAPEKILKRGIVIARRDFCKYLRKVYTRILRNVLILRPMEETFDMIVDAVKDLVEGRVGLEDVAAYEASNGGGDVLFLGHFVCSMFGVSPKIRFASWAASVDTAIFPGLYVVNGLRSPSGTPRFFSWVGVGSFISA